MAPPLHAAAYRTPILEQCDVGETAVFLEVSGWVWHHLCLSRAAQEWFAQIIGIH